MAAKMSSLFTKARFADPRSATQRAAVAVSACLAGQRVRYDGDDKLLPAFEQLSRALELIPICPEVGAGLSVPRPPVQLVEHNATVRALGRENPKLDVTAPLQRFAEDSLDQLVSAHTLCGYLWKSRSPSCGLNSTPLFDGAGHQIGLRSGIQATQFQNALPWLCYAEETHLVEAVAIDCFVLRCRLVYDVMHCGQSLAALHHHYQFLIERLPENARAQLTQLCSDKSKGAYLTALLFQCGQIDREELLSLFGA